MKEDYYLLITTTGNLILRDLELKELNIEITKYQIGNVVSIENYRIDKFDYGHNIPSHYGEMVYHKNVLFSVVKYETYSDKAAKTYLKIESVL